MNPKSMEFAENSEGYEEMINIQVYPNPANDFINVEMLGPDEQESIIISLTNPLGIRVLEKTLTIFSGVYQLDVSALSQGLYIYDVISANSGEPFTKGIIVIQH